jgi:hypothetical protein
MRISETLRIVTGSVVVYYVMAACSSPAGVSSGPTSGSSSSSSGGSASGAVASSNGSSGSPVADANADETQSGSRLKANYYLGGDGSKQFAFFTDSQRSGEQCSFETASDGSTRCLPAGASMGSFYSDSGCTVPLALTTSCSTAPAYAVAYTSTTCGVYKYHVYPVSGPFSGATVYDGTPASCNAVPTSELPATYGYYTIGTEVPASSFQVATIAAQ